MPATNAIADQSADWAYSALADWGVTFTDRRNHPARAVHAAGRGDIRAAPVLLDTANDTGATGMQRASAITHLGRLLPEQLMPSLPLWLGSRDPLIRLAAAEAIGQLPPEQRQALLRPLSQDPVLAVRMMSAEQLVGLVPAASGSPGQKDPFEALFREYITVQSQHLDMPSVLTQLSSFQQARGETEAALSLLQSALRKNPEASVSRVNLADLYRTLGNEAAARETLETGIALNADDGALWFSLALLEVREGNAEQGLRALAKAASLEETPGYYHYVLAVAQNDQGLSTEALATLKATHRAAPGQPNVLAALMQYSQLAGDRQSAQRYRDELRATVQAAGLQ